MLKLMARVIYRLWKDDNKDLMIMPASLPLHDGGSRNELIYYLPAGWDPVVERDIDGDRAETTELENKEPRFGQLNAAHQISLLTISSPRSSRSADWMLAFLIDVAESIERLKDRFDFHEATTAEYGLLLEHVARQATQASGDEKLAAYRAILLNTCLPSAPDKLERAYFLDLLNRLQEVHIVVLSLFRDQYAFGKIHNSAPPTNMGAGSLGSTISAYLKPIGIADELARCAIRDLDTMGILPGLHGQEMRIQLWMPPRTCVK